MSPNKIKNTMLTKSQDITLLEKYQDFFLVLNSKNSKNLAKTSILSILNSIEYFIEEDRVVFNPNSPIKHITLDFKKIGYKENINIPKLTISPNSKYKLISLKIILTNINCKTIDLNSIECNELTIEGCFENINFNKKLTLDYLKLKGVNKQINYNEKLIINDKLKIGHSKLKDINFLSNQNILNLIELSDVIGITELSNINTKSLSLKDSSIKTINSLSLEEIKLENASPKLNVLSDLPNLKKITSLSSYIEKIKKCKKLEQITFISNQKKVYIENDVIESLTNAIIKKDLYNLDKKYEIVAIQTNINFDMITINKINILSNLTILVPKNANHTILFSGNNIGLSSLNSSMYYHYNNDRDRNEYNHNPKYNLLNNNDFLLELCEKLKLSPLMEKLLSNQYNEIDLNLIEKYAKVNDILGNNFVYYICSKESLDTLAKISINLFNKEDINYIVPPLKNKLEYYIINKELKNTKEAHKSESIKYSLPRKVNI